MGLEPGTQLGSFEITGLLGKGGMGEVYSARDRTLDRYVAIKILPEYFAADEERLARFEREAQTLAALNHPNIATVHGFEHDEERGLHYLVMEHIDGETLGEVIFTGPLLVSALLPIFIDIARGLDAAHEAGIVHRDLKPDNVKINGNGAVKILDFGLAKGKVKSQPTNPDAPTTPMSPVAVTAEGTFLGTPSYMSPEQAQGKDVDRRTDIWAFGCCLYQALTGDIPFKGDTIADIVGSILKTDPDWSKLTEDVPESVRSLLRRCLEKDPRHRLSSAGDIAITLEEAQETLKRGRDSLPATVAPKRRLRMNFLVFVLCLAVGAAAMYAFQRVKGIAESTSPGAAGVPEPPAVTVSPGSSPLRRYSITLDPKAPVADDPWYDYGMLASPPDGSAVIYPVRPSEGRVLMQRPLDDLDAQPIPGTEGALYIMFSPSGQRAAFHKDGAYWVIPGQGGKPRKVLDALLPLAAVWEDETHVITGSPNPGQGLVRLNVDTGDHEMITDLGDRAFHVTSYINREKHVLFYFPEGWPDIYALNRETGESKALDIAGLLPQYVSSGYLVYSLPGALMAVTFDIDRLETTGAPVDVTPPYMGSTNRFMPGYAIMPGGELVYVRAGASPQAQSSFVWVDMDGVETPLNLPTVESNAFALTQSADSLRLLYPSGGLLWVHDVDSGLPPQQVTFEPEPVTSPLWIDAGQTFVYSARQMPAFDYSLYRSNTSGLQQAELLCATLGDQWFLGAFCVTPDRSALLGTIYSTSASDVSAQVVEFPLDGSGEPRPLLQDPKICGRAALSPDGRWLAYVAGDDLSQLDILVTSYPDLKGRWRISSTDLPYFHDLPRWAPDGSVIYYRSRSQVVRVPVLTDDGFRVGHPEELFEDHYYRNVSQPPSWYALDPDGTRFLFLKTETQMLENATELLVIEHWVDHLRDFNPEKL